MRAGLKKLLILAVISGLGWLTWEFFFKPEPVIYGLTSSAITRGDITSTVTATGELNAISVVEIGTQVSGTVQEIYVDFNSPVIIGEMRERLQQLSIQKVQRWHPAQDERSQTAIMKL